uniref:CBS domain-containing protein n=1 Tax=Chenopodium quinoa TaxID=63459 RepID=A0A803LPV7_CHEQI
MFIPACTEFHPDIALVYPLNLQHSRCCRLHPRRSSESHSSKEDPQLWQPKTKALSENFCGAHILLDQPRRYDPALSALRAINNSLSGQTAVAVVDDEGRLVGEISLYTLACCDETVAPAVATLSAGDLMAYIDYGGAPEDLIQLVKARLEEKKLDGFLELLEDDHSTLSVSSCLSSTSSSSSDDEAVVKSMRSRSNSARFARGTEPIVCHPGSSVIAVMIQALSHRLNHVWVVEEDYRLVGIVTFTSMLKVFRDRVNSFS